MKTYKSYIPGLLIAILIVLFSSTGYSTKWLISVADFQFTPASIPNVNAGDTIRWNWVSGTHTTTSTTIPSGATSWDHPIDASNTFFEYVPGVNGTFNYHCMHHPSMTGSFTVTGFVSTLLVTPSNQNVTYVVGTTDFTVTSNSSWTAVSNQTWCTCTPSGTGNGIIVANYVSNPLPAQRVASITVTVTGLTPQVVTVTQDGAPKTLAVAPPSQNVSMPAGATDFTVTSNSDWTAVSNQTWCTVTPSGTGNGTIVANYTDNSSGPPRVASITVTVSGLAPQVVTVNQDGTTGIPVNTVNSMVLYPNPTSGAITLVTGNMAVKKETLSVMDLTGRLVYSNVVFAGQQYTLDLSSQPGGYYFIQLVSDAGVVTKKVILDK
ncbi:MAG: T9SS type A sorting domain-containing protein [Bacteroidetes bacterium]|nr:T9SS type A sorting domain-containing protein [Bacteroidota bacterium]